MQLRSSRALGLVALLAAVGSAAGSARRQVQLTYERTGAAQRCPDEQYIKDAVAARLGYSPFSADAGTVLRAALSSRGKVLVARLEKEVDGGSASRELTSGSGDCAELLSSLTLGLSIAIDESALLPPAGSAASAERAGRAAALELFEDRGSTYVRAGSAEGLQVGSALEVLPQGSGTVMEVWAHLARVNLDPAALANPPPRQARLSLPVSGLKGGAESTGIGDLRRITLTNSGATRWSNCEVRLPSGARYRMAELRPHEVEGIMFFRFEQGGPPSGVPFDSVLVRCAEGESTFRFAP
jgi:hypothetical protein